MSRPRSFPFDHLGLPHRKVRHAGIRSTDLNGCEPARTVTKTSGALSGACMVKPSTVPGGLSEKAPSTSFPWFNSVTAPVATSTVETRLTVPRVSAK